MHLLCRLSCPRSCSKHLLCPFLVLVLALEHLLCRLSVLVLAIEASSVPIFHSTPKAVHTHTDASNHPHPYTYIQTPTTRLPPTRRSRDPSRYTTIDVGHPRRRSRDPTPERTEDATTADAPHRRLVPGDSATCPMRSIAAGLRPRLGLVFALLLLLRHSVIPPYVYTTIPIKPLPFAPPTPTLLILSIFFLDFCPTLWYT